MKIHTDPNSNFTSDPQPETIRLSDGREFSVIQLLSTVTEPQMLRKSGATFIRTHSFRIPRVPELQKKPQTRHRRCQYSQADREFIITASVSQLRARYQITDTQLFNLIQNSLQTVGRPYRSVQLLRAQMQQPDATVSELSEYL